MGVASGIDLDPLLAAATLGSGLPGAQIGGRVREAMAASRKREPA